jgi:hypothetical protein
MWLRKDTGGTAIGPYEWPEDGSVTEVGEEFGRSLLAIPEGGFEKVSEPSREIAGGRESRDGDGEQDAGGEETGDAGDGTESDGEPPPPGGGAGSAPGTRRRTRKTAVQE